MKKISVESQADKAGRNNGNGIRDSFIRAGLDLFGECGLDGASTRMLAKKAGANISGIVYYFGGKEGLYQAVLEHIAGRFNDLTSEVRQKAWKRLEEPLEKPEALSLIKDLLTALSGVMDDQKKVKNAEKIILREQTSPTSSFALLYEGYMKDILSLLVNLISRYTGQPGESPGVVFRAHSLVGQVIAFIATREALLKNLGLKRLGPEHSAMIHQVIMVNVEACLKAWAE